MKIGAMENLCSFLLVVTALMLGLCSTGVRADDTEIYQVEYDAISGGRPKVLIVFDDSGSMATMVEGQRPPYDPSATYDVKFNESRIYWSNDSDDVPGVGSDNWMNAGVNRCASSYRGLENQGFFDTKARRWVDSTVIEGDCEWSCPSGFYRQFSNQSGWGCYSRECRFSWFGLCLGGYDYVFEEPATQFCEGNSVQVGTWQALDDDVHNPPHLECKVDVDNTSLDNGNGQLEGYPQNNVESGNEYGGSVDNTVDWGDEPYRLYTGHYLNWYYDESLLEDRSRIDIAQEVVTSLIQANSGIDFGLLEFNGNWSNTSAHGGRVVHRIIQGMSAADRQNVVDMVNTMTASGSTPLCESTYEAYRYLAGQSVYFGDNDDGHRDGDLLARDTLAESPAGTYDSPATDCAITYVIIMTDGFPQNDTSANDEIESLTGKTCSNYAVDGSGTQKNCLPVLTDYMSKTDLDGDTTNGLQVARTYTIGFATDQTLLEDAATVEDGYYTANNAQELTDAFQGAILSILSTESTFTSPAVAVDTFTRTRSRNEVFYAMFKPTNTTDWPGNIKKLKLSLEEGEEKLIDAAGNAGIDPDTGEIAASARTFWSLSVDGADVETGGVGELLANREPSTRSLYSDTGSGGALEAMTSTNISPDAFGFATEADLWNHFGVNTSSALAQQLAWAQGYDAYDQDGDGTTDEPRDWILGDILHSQPLVLNYGALGSFTEDNPDLRIVTGTNAGFVHMFGNDDGQEDWAFFPKELAPILKVRRTNGASDNNVYGVDLVPVAYTEDIDNDGTLDSSDGDKAYVYFGMRRGGQSLYALDLSNPDTPAFLWSLNTDSSGMGELGLTWSVPVVTRIPGYRDVNGVPKPVLVFGAGYDLNKDSSGIATPDTSGRGIFVVDAASGQLVWSVTPGANSARNLQASALNHSVPGRVTVLDSNGDSLTDRIYFGDTGGNVWRVDLVGNSLPTSSQDTWRITQLADFNAASASTDRRFFNAPDLVRIRFDGEPVDALIIGSGDRTNPNATDVDNRVYMIRDEAVMPYTTDYPTTAECDAMTDKDFRCSLPLYDNNLYDITSNIINTGTDEEKSVALAALRAANGWRFDLQGHGEKNLAETLTIDGRVYVPTFTPDNILDNINACEPEAGQGRQYVFDLYTGGRQWIPLGPIIPDTPSVHFGEDGKIRVLLPPGAPGGDLDGDGESDCDGGICDVGSSLRAPYGTYWFQEEY